MQSIEAWIEERVVQFLAELEGGLAKSPEEFVDGLEGESRAPFSRPESRALLLDRLRAVLATERRLGGGEADLEPGGEVGDFQILERLGQGGMGVVFRARQQSLGREVALKVPHWSLHPRERRRFEREAQAVAQLHHPAIVALFEAGELAGRPYFAMELVRGRSLSDVVRDVREGRLPRDGASLGRPDTSWERAVAELGREVLDGLEAAHAEGVVHRDLKPSNLLLQPDGRARILDFGLARLEGDEPLTGSHDFLGTPDYLAPELIDDPRSASRWSDVYAVGVLLYELLTLEHPFRAPTPAATLVRIQQGDPLSARRRDRRVPKPLSAILEKATAGQIDRRYTSAAAFAADLEACLEGREVSARASTGLERWGRKMQRHPAVTALVVVLVVVLAILSTVAKRSHEVHAAIARDEARDLFREATLLEFQDAGGFGGPAMEEAGRRAAIEKLRSALERDPDFVEARLLLAAFLRDIGEREESEAQLSNAVALRDRHLSHDWIRSSWADRRDTMRPPDDLSLEELASNFDRYIWARSCQRLGKVRLGDAVDACQLLRTDPLYGPAALVVEGTCYLSRGYHEPHRAARSFQAAHALAPGNPVIIANLAYALMKAWDLQERSTIGSGEKAKGWPRDPNLPDLLEEAETLLSQAAPKEPRLEAFWLNYGHLMAAYRRDLPRAREIYERGFELMPESAILRSEAAETYLEEIGQALKKGAENATGKLSSAEALLQEAWAVGPDDSKTARRFAYLHHYLALAADEPPTSEVLQVLSWARLAQELGATGRELQSARAVESWALKHLEKGSPRIPDAR